MHDSAVCSPQITCVGQPGLVGVVPGHGRGVGLDDL